jgi:hypothetical protein
VAGDSPHLLCHASQWDGSSAIAASHSPFAPRNCPWVCPVYLRDAQFTPLTGTLDQILQAQTLAYDGHLAGAGGTWATIQAERPSSASTRSSPVHSRIPNTLKMAPITCWAASHGPVADTGPCR